MRFRGHGGWPVTGTQHSAGVSGAIHAFPLQGPKRPSGQTVVLLVWNTHVASSHVRYFLLSARKMAPLRSVRGSGMGMTSERVMPQKTVPCSCVSSK